MMRKLLAIALLCVAVPGLAAQLHIAPSPVHLDGMFRVVLAGDAEQGTIVTVFNLRSKEHVTLELRADGDGWVTDPIAAMRPCVCEPPTAAARLEVDLGDILVAAIETEGVGPARARVGRAEADPTIELWRLDTAEKDYVEAETLISGVYALEIADASESISCALDYLTAVPVALGQRGAHLVLEETDATSGRFVAHFQVHVRPQDGKLRVELIGPDGEEISEPWSEELSFTVQYEGERVELQVAPPFPVDLSHDRLTLPWGCCQEMTIAEPTAADEYVWYEGETQLGNQPWVMLCGDSVKEWTEVRAFVRKGIHWGVAVLEYRVVPQASLMFLDAETGQQAPQPWSRERELQVLLEHVYTEEPPTVRVGVLGEGDERRLDMNETDEGMWVSDPLRPRDLGAGAGDVVWALYRDPEFPSCNWDYETLRIK